MSHFERLGLLLLGLLLFLPGIAGRDLWDPDEPRYAEVAREMKESGEWFLPHLNGKVYSEKPPLHFWLIGAAALATGGVGPVAARLPSLLAGLTTLFLLFAMARRLFDRRVAWWSVLILATSARVLWQARVGQIDMLLMCMVTLAMYFFVRGWLEHRRGFFRLFFVAAGLGTLAKGPAGLLPPLLAIVVFAVATRESGRLRELRIPTGLAIWAAVVLLWLLPGGLAGGAGYVETVVFKQNVTRYLDPWHHFRPFYYYFTTVPVDFLPWAFFLPGAIWLGWRRTTGNERRGYLFAVCWMAVTVLFFSLSPAKRTVYVLQMFPAMAMLVAWSCAEIDLSWDRLRRFALAPAALLTLTFAAVPVGWLALRRFRPAVLEELGDQLEPLGPGVLARLGVVIGLLLAGALAAWILGRRGGSSRVIGSLAAGTGAAGLAAVLLVLPRFDHLKSSRVLSQKLTEVAAPGDAYAIYPHLDSRFVFHTRRFAETPSTEAELLAFAQRPGVFLLIDKRTLDGLELPLPMEEVARDEARVDGFVLLASPRAEAKSD
jgi:4-amino-4-deoxy-L-arabinose transferase-like glycosyltransferase